MKNLITTLMLIALANVLVAQNIIKVNNLTGVTDLDYNNIDTAIAYAQAGDIIMVYGTPSDYGDIHIDKPVKIVGPGYYLTQNPQTSIVGASAKIDNIYFENGANGASIEGLRILDDIHIQTDSVMIKRCYIFSQIFLFGHDNITVTQSHVGGGILGAGASNANDLLVSNSIVYGISNNSTFYKTSGLFINNLIYGTALTSRLPVNSLYTNNIFASTGGRTVNNIQGANIFKNNLFADSNQNYVPDSTVAGNTGNIIGVDISMLFVGTTGNSIDGQYQLKTGSVAIGAGLNGVDCGIFGGATPYVLSGIPSIPNIYELSAPIQTTPSGTLPVIIKLKANN